MDDEARQLLGRQALLQHAHEQAKRGRQNLPIGVVLMGIGVTIVVVGLMVELPPFLALGVGMLMIPAGLAVVIKSIAAIAQPKRVARAQQLPEARVVD
jgi:hypothetical protein